MNTKPARLLLLLLAAVCLLALAGALVGGQAATAGAVLNRMAGGALLLLLAAAAIDFRRGRRRSALRFERELPSQFVQGQAHDVVLGFTPPADAYWRQPRSLLLADLHPPAWQTDQPLLTLQTLPGRTSRIRYRITPMQRGEAAFSGLEYWLSSPWGLWLRRYRQDLPATVKVLPDFSRILGSELVGMQRWLNWVGVKKLPRLGQGQDFHQLRDYQEGDDIRHVDWKATSRLNKAIVRNYQQEQDQQVLFLLDCGRHMRLHMERLSHFDHSLQAMLLLSFTALKQGDAVGLLTYAHDAPRFVPPHKGMAQLGRLVQGVYDIEPSVQAGDLAAAVNMLLHKQKRRALVVVLTHLNHEDDGELTAQLLRLKHHHLVLVASLRPHAPDALMAADIHNSDDAAAYWGAWQYRSQTEQALQSLNAHGIACLNTLPKQLSTELINRYLRLKRRHAW